MDLTPASARSQSDQEHRLQCEVLQRAFGDMLEPRLDELVQNYPQTPLGVGNLRHRVFMCQRPEQVPDLLAVGNSRVGWYGTRNRRAITTDCRDSQGRPPLKQMYQKISHYRNSGLDQICILSTTPRTEFCPLPIIDGSGRRQLWDWDSVGSLLRKASRFEGILDNIQAW